MTSAWSKQVNWVVTLIADFIGLIADPIMLAFHHSPVTICLHTASRDLINIKTWTVITIAFHEHVRNVCMYVGKSSERSKFFRTIKISRTTCNAKNKLPIKYDHRQKSPRDRREPFL
jgi:hypothetical protein